VAELQGTIALVSHDDEASRVWRERYGFRPAVAEEGQTDPAAVAAASRLDGLMHYASGGRHETILALTAQRFRSEVLSAQAGA
jgi:hypothetical protein